jgi:Na+-transporting methylmalonyl-CoA/oxaloacetate decarboxylase gamma subunit
MTLLAVTADTWIVTGLGFGIVLALLCCLVFILKAFGWTMQKIEAPRKPKAEKKEVLQSPIVASPADDTAAVAYALYLASQDVKHDAPTSMIASQVRGTAWNTKSIGLNNIGF